MKKPELLVPARSLEDLKVGLGCGAHTLNIAARNEDLGEMPTLLQKLHH